MTSSEADHEQTSTMLARLFERAEAQRRAAAPPAGVVLLSTLDQLARQGARIQRIPESEDGFLGWVRDLARRRPVADRWRTYHTLRSKGSEPGFPDLILVRPPRLIFAELKSDRGRLTKAQREWRADLEACGVEVYTWRPSERSQVEDILR